jgi:hypothetical protein
VFTSIGLNCVCVHNFVPFGRPYIPDVSSSLKASSARNIERNIVTSKSRTDYKKYGGVYSVTRLSQRLLPNVVLKFYQIRYFFTKHVQIPRFEISGCVQSL